MAENDPLTIHLRGSVWLDDSNTVYVAGMDLGDILRAALPDVREGGGRYRDTEITVKVVCDGA